MDLPTATTDHLFLREGTTYSRIPLSDIYFIQADGNYAYIQTTDKRYAIKRSLATIAEGLEGTSFIRASRSLLVNFDRVSTLSFAEGRIQVGPHSVKLGKAYHADVKERMPRL